MGQRIQARTTDGRYTQNTFEQLGLSVATCAECHGWTPYARGDSRDARGTVDPFAMNGAGQGQAAPTHCSRCGASFVEGGERVDPSTLARPRQESQSLGGRTGIMATLLGID